MRSVGALLCAKDELLLVDGGSRDGTPTLAREVAGGVERLRVLEAPTSRAHQMNLGAQEARNDWLLFLHADSRVSSASLNAVREAARDPNTLWGHLSLRIDDAARAFRLIELGVALRSRLGLGATGDQAIFVRRAAFLGLGGYPLVPLLEDVMLTDRLGRITPPTALRARVETSPRRWRQQGVIRTTFRMWAIRLAYRFGIAPDRLAGHYPPLER